MAPRVVLPIRASIAGKRAPVFFRYNSSSASAGAGRMAQYAASADRPAAMEVSVPVMWAVCGSLIYAAWSRQSETTGEHVEALNVV